MVVQIQARICKHPSITPIMTMFSVRMLKISRSRITVDLLTSTGDNADANLWMDISVPRLTVSIGGSVPFYVAVNSDGESIKKSGTRNPTVSSGRISPR